MTGFEYLAAYLSVVAGLAITQIMGGIANLVEARGRVKYDWIHSFWVLNILILNVQVWWGMWGLQDYTNWNFRAFALVLAIPGVLYFVSRLLAPDDIGPTRHVSMAEHYETVRPVFFILLAVYGVLSILANRLLFGSPIFSMLAFIPAASVLGAALCAWTPHRAVHATYAVLIFVAAVVFIALDTQVLV